MLVILRRLVWLGLRLRIKVWIIPEPLIELILGLLNFLSVSFLLLSSDEVSDWVYRNPSWPRSGREPEREPNQLAPRPRIGPG